MKSKYTFSTASIIQCIEKYLFWGGNINIWEYKYMLDENALNIIFNDS